MTDNRVIPTEAIEVAMRVWGVKGEDQRRIVTCILEAAAPHMLAGAKAEALEEAAEDASSGNGGGHDSGECDDWAAWLRARAAALRPTP